MANFYDVAQAIQQPNIVGSFNQGVQTAQRNNLYNEQQQVFQQQQAQQQKLQNLAPQVIAGDPNAFAQAAAIDPDAAAKYQGAGDQQLTRLRGALNYLDQARKTGNPAAIDAAWQQAKPFLSQIAGKPAPDHWDPSFEPGLEQALAKVSQLPQQKSDLINVGAGGAVFDPSTGKPVYTNPGVQKPMQVVSIPDGHGGTIQGFADPTTGVVRPATYQGAQGAPAGNPAHQTMIMPATPQDASAPSSVTSASPVNAGAVDQANALLAQGLTPEAVMQQLVAAHPDQQFSLSLDQQTGKFKDATPFPTQPAQTGGLGFTPAKPGAGSLIAQRQKQIQDLEDSGVHLTDTQRQNYLTTGKPGEDSGATAEDPLAGLSPSDAALVRSIATYRTLPSSLGRSSNRAELLARANMLNPDYNEGAAKGAYTYITDLSKNGPTSAGGTVQSINTGLNHLGTLMRANDELAGTSFPLINSATNAISTATGGTGATNWKQATYLFSQEMAKLVKGGVANEGEVRDIVDQLSASKSPRQRDQAIQQAAEFMYGRIQAVEDRGDRVLGSLAPDVSLMTKEAQDNLRKAYKLGGREVPDLKPPGDAASYLKRVYGAGNDETTAASSVGGAIERPVQAPQATQDFSHLWSGQ